MSKEKEVKLEGTSWNVAWVRSHKNAKDFIGSKSTQKEYLKFKDKRESLLTKVYEECQKEEPKAKK